jgi:hypothetical protein
MPCEAWHGIWLLRNRFSYTEFSYGEHDTISLYLASAFLCLITTVCVGGRYRYRVNVKF